MGRQTRIRLFLIAVLPFVLLAGVLLLAKKIERAEPDTSVFLASVAAPQADSPPCQALMAQVPDQLGAFVRAKARDPAPVSAAAWRGKGGELIELRCGTPRPAELRRDSYFQEVSGVKWLGVGDQSDRSPRTWVAVDRDVYVHLECDPGLGTAPVQLISEAIVKALPAKTPDLGS